MYCYELEKFHTTELKPVGRPSWRLLVFTVAYGLVGECLYWLFGLNKPTLFMAAFGVLSAVIYKIGEWHIRDEIRLRPDAIVVEGFEHRIAVNVGDRSQLLLKFLAKKSWDRPEIVDVFVQHFEGEIRVLPKQGEYFMKMFQYLPLIPAGFVAITIRDHLTIDKELLQACIQLAAILVFVGVIRGQISFILEHSPRLVALRDLVRTLRETKIALLARKMGDGRSDHSTGGVDPTNPSESGSSSGRAT